MEKTPEERQDEQVKRQLSLLKKLSVTEEFRVWRDLVVKPKLEALEADLANPLGISEAELKAKLIATYQLKGFFYLVFDEAEAQLKLEQN